MMIKNYAYWAIDTYIPNVAQFKAIEATYQADRLVNTAWIQKEQTLYSKRASIASLDDYGYQDRWYQLGHYDAEFSLLDNRDDLSSVTSDYVEYETLTPPNKRWLDKAVTTNKWAERPYDETIKIWREY